MGEEKRAFKCFGECDGYVVIGWAGLCQTSQDDYSKETKFHFLAEKRHDLVKFVKCFPQTEDLQLNLEDLDVDEILDLSPLKELKQLKSVQVMHPPTLVLSTGEIAFRVDGVESLQVEVQQDKTKPSYERCTYMKKIGTLRDKATSIKTYCILLEITTPLIVIGTDEKEHIIPEWHGIIITDGSDTVTCITETERFTIKWEKLDWFVKPGMEPYVSWSLQ